MSIRFRLNALMVTLLSLALVSFVSAMIMSAGPRIRAENESIMRLSKEFVETAVESLQGTTNPGARLTVLLDGLKDLRHVHIYRSASPGAPAPEESDAATGEAPAWLARLAHPVPLLEVPVFVNGQSFGDLVIAPQAADESAEIWDSIVKVSAVGTALAIATLLLMSLLIAHLLKPIRTVGDALLLLDSGTYDVAVPETGPPEIADICGKLNRLASTLKGTISENQRLAKRIICIQDEERKDLARELHDELGPYLFAIRAGASTIKSELERGGGKPKLLHTCDTLLERIETMQHMNRRVLHKLRPIGLDAFGLEANLVSLVAMWRENHPDTAIALNVSDATPERDETSNLTIYRIVQEGLTNAFRHADATAIEIVVEASDPGHDMPGTPRRGSARASVHVTVTDNGRGLAEEVTPSYGITGMTERVWATGGEMRIFNRASGGVTLEAWVPASAFAEGPRPGESAASG
jgi:two-component system sensor histidine kinase UhpB